MADRGDISDEDQEVDIESDDDDASSSAGGSTYMSEADKKAHHNALERKRRDHIKESFAGLRACLPTTKQEKEIFPEMPEVLSDGYANLTKSGSRGKQRKKQMVPKNDCDEKMASRAQILKQATDYIQQMTSKNVSVQKDIENIRKQNHYLRQQAVQNAERSKAAGYSMTNSFHLMSESNNDYAEHSDSDDSSDLDTPAKKPKKLKTGK